MNASMAVRLGLLKFPAPGMTFPGRAAGKPKNYVIDTRGAGMNLKLRELIVSMLMNEFTRLPKFDVLGGISKSGTVWAAWMAWMSHLPFANVLLDGKRESGLQREVEGDVCGLRILLVDNWTRTGNSIRQAADVVGRAGGVAVAAITVVRHSDIELPFPLNSPWTISELLDAAGREGLWNSDQQTTT